MPSDRRYAFALVSYAFEIAEPIPLAVARIMGEQLDRVAALLAERKVHDVRKRFKEIRALLRMLRPSIGDVFAVENAWYRDAGRDFAAARDAEAARAAVEKLLEGTADDERAALAAAKKSLRRAGLRRGDLDARAENILAQLGDARARVAAWPALEDRFATIGEGMERTMRDGRAALAAVLRDPAPERFHELRKRVKDHWYHLQLLRRINPPVLAGQAAALEDLSRTLGDHHDLDVLRTLLGDAAPQAIIDTRRRELETAAVAGARFVYSEPPAAWRRRMRGYWRAAQGPTATP